LFGLIDLWMYCGSGDPLQAWTPAPHRVVVLLAFQAGDPMLVNFGYMHQPGDSFHDLAKAPVALLVFGCGLPVLDCQQLDRLRQSFVAFFELFEGHIN